MFIYFYAKERERKEAVIHNHRLTKATAKNSDSTSFRSEKFKKKKKQQTTTNPTKAKNPTIFLAYQLVQEDEQNEEQIQWLKHNI